MTHANHQGEPGAVRYQCREIGEGEDWRDCSKETYDSFATHPTMDIRIVPAGDVPCWDPSRYDQGDCSFPACNCLPPQTHIPHDEMSPEGKEALQAIVQVARHQGEPGDRGTGWVLVPREPTEAMIEAGAAGSGEDSENVARGAWEAMIASAPSPDPAGAGGDLGELEKLSAAATQGDIVAEPYTDDHGGSYLMAGEIQIAAGLTEEDGAYLAALARDHRSGKLVASTGSGKETKGATPMGSGSHPSDRTPSGSAGYAVSILRARPLSEWTEEDGDVLWWRFPIEEPPYCGSPNDLGQDVLITVSRFGHEDGQSRHMVGGWPGYHTHWTPILMPATHPDVPGPQWPDGCIKPGSCSRHAACMYARSAEQCVHFGKDLTGEIKAAEDAR